MGNIIENCAFGLIYLIIAFLFITVLGSLVVMAGYMWVIAYQEVF